MVLGLVLPSAGLGLVPACGPSCPLVASSSPFCHPPLGDFQVEIAFYKRSYLGPAGKEMAPKKKKREEGNISGYLFLCPCDATDRNLGGTRACLVPLHVHQVMSPQELASGGGRRGGGGSHQAGEAVWSLDLQEYPKEVGTLRDTGSWNPQQGPGGDSKGRSRWGPEQAEQGVLDLRAHWGDTGDMPDAWGAWKLL